jgi:hypothetical protein
MKKENPLRILIERDTSGRWLYHHIGDDGSISATGSYFDEPILALMRGIHSAQDRAGKRADQGTDCRNHGSRNSGIREEQSLSARKCKGQLATWHADNGPKDVGAARKPAKGTKQ